MDEYQRFFEQMPIIALLVRDGAIARLTQAASRLLGDRFLGRPLSDLLPPNEASLILEKATDEQSLVLYGVPIANAYNTYFDLQSACSDGSVWLVLYPQPAVHDLSDSLYMSAMSILGQEIRAPLTTMLSAVSLLSKQMESTASEEKSRRYFASLLQNCFRLLRLSNNLIELPQYAAGTMSLYLQERDLSAFVSEVFDSIGPYAAARELSTRFEGTGAPLRISFDEQKIERLLYCLLANALKHTPAGGLISLSVTSDAEFAYLRISDTGNGIPPEKLSYLFRAHASHSLGGGTLGLGLSLVRLIAELHGGAIVLESRPDMGTVVTVSLRRNKSPSNVLRNRPPADYTGEFPHVLVELSDSIPGGHPLYDLSRGPIQP